MAIHIFRHQEEMNAVEAWTDHTPQISKLIHTSHEDIVLCVCQLIPGQLHPIATLSGISFV